MKTASFVSNLNNFKGGPCNGNFGFISILNPSDCINGGDDALSHQQIGIELAKQQQIGIELAALHEKFVQQQAG